MADEKSEQPPPLMGATAIKPPERHGMEKFTYLLYDPKTGTYLTRTPKSWALIIIFYCIYYSCLAGFWLGLMKVFLTTVPMDEPKWQQASSIIGVNPGVGVRPAQKADQLETGIFELDLKFDGTDDGLPYDQIATMAGSKGYALRMKKFFETYENNTKDEEMKKLAVECSGNPDKYHEDRSTFCRFDRTTLGSCMEFPYGYSHLKFEPCVFLKLNRIWGLKPEPIGSMDDVDESLQKDPFVKKLKADIFPKKIFVNCEPEYPADKETVELNPFPADKGIPLKYFPFQMMEMKENALLALKFTGLEKHKGRLIHIICKAYYKGVVHSKKDKAGLVKFELFLKD